MNRKNIKLAHDMQSDNGLSFSSDNSTLRDDVRRHREDQEIEKQVEQQEYELNRETMMRQKQMMVLQNHQLKGRNIMENISGEESEEVQHALYDSDSD